MFDYKQRETTPEYRENWERIYGYRNGCPILEDECLSQNDSLGGQTRQRDGQNSAQPK